MLAIIKEPRRSSRSSRRSILTSPDSALVTAMEQTQQDSILSLSKKVSELAEVQTSHGSVPQGEFVKAIQRLQIAVEGPAHYVARLRHQVRNQVLPAYFDQS